MALLRFAALAVTAVVLLATLGIGIFYWVFARSISADIETLLREARAPNVTVTEAMLAGLPEPAQRYFRFAGVVGHAIPRIVRISQKGRIRGSAAENWMSFEADETYSTNPPAFVWRASFPAVVAPVALGRDEYLGGRGSILMKMLAVVPLADEHGDELAAAGLMRYLNESMWFPASLLGPNVRISPIDDASFRATLSDRGLSAEAIFFVDGEGRLVNFRASRYDTGTGAVGTWETPVSGYRSLGGLNLPTSGSAVWKRDTGDFNYIELEVTDLTYE
jgi:hypothetical protein